MGGGTMTLKMKEEWLDVPVMRKTVKVGDHWTSPHKWLCYESATHALDKVQQQAGFTEKVTFYCLRRSSIDLMNSVATASEADLRCAAGHNSASKIRGKVEVLAAKENAAALPDDSHAAASNVANILARMDLQSLNGLRMMHEHRRDVSFRAFMETSFSLNPSLPEHAASLTFPRTMPPATAILQFVPEHPVPAPARTAEENDELRKDWWAQVRRTNLQLTTQTAPQDPEAQRLLSPPILMELTPPRPRKTTRRRASPEPVSSSRPRKTTVHCASPEPISLVSDD
ncbi:hypothetical protein HDU89_006274 [Geranomyces variabilis]|nr:hypothetical protein HDU89_006274 [Geranomyces variabilis]